MQNLSPESLEMVGADAVGISWPSIRASHRGLTLASESGGLWGTVEEGLVSPSGVPTSVGQTSSSHEM